MTTPNAPATFRALVLTEEDGKTHASMQTVEQSALPEGDTLVRVAYSGLNYKDGLAILGRNKVVRSFPMVPGIDLAGEVVESSSPDFAPGDRIVSTGWGVGERHWGGMAQYARLKSEWLVKVPDELSLTEAMGVGTAGFTAMLCIMALEQHGFAPGGREALVTGAAGGVGSMAVALLANSGYRVVAATGRVDEARDYLTELGAHELLDRATLTAPGAPLASARWGGVVDTVGGPVLAGALRSAAYGASVAACGNAGGMEFTTTVLPFILRAVNLLGIDSLPTPIEIRREAWARIATTLPKRTLDLMMRVEPLSEAPRLAEEIMRGQIRGHVVLDVNE